MQIMRWELAALTTVVMLLLALGYMGRWHPAGDSFAVFRAQGAAGLGLVALGCLALDARWLGGLGLAMAMLTGVPLLMGYSQQGPAGALTLYQKNMLFRNDDLAALAADIRAVAPDVLTLQEVTQANRALLAGLADVLPGQVYCPFRTVGGVAVATRWPVVPGSQTCAPGLAAMQAETPQGRVWLVALHLSSPWPYEQAAHLAKIVPVLEALDGPVILGGDFNAVPWGAAVARLAEATHSQLARPIRGTLPRFGPLLVLPIDHVLLSQGGRTDLREVLGSDHRGVVVRFGL
jgi:endonuclease/exonuclease/phosphatase (EEP) superfamily protein YafD